MKSLLFVLMLLTPPMLANAVTDNPDGGVTFSREEAVNLLENFRAMEAQNAQNQQDIRQAQAIFRAMAKKIEELEKRTCT